MWVMVYGIKQLVFSLHSWNFFSTRLLVYSSTIKKIRQTLYYSESALSILIYYLRISLSGMIWYISLPEGE